MVLADNGLCQLDVNHQKADIDIGRICLEI